jgi:CRP-like cAMP-binding protein
VCELISGTAKVIRQGDVVATINSGEFFGTIAALTGNKRHASIIASEPCMLRKITRHQFRLLLQTQPDVLDRLR